MQIKFEAAVALDKIPRNVRILLNDKALKLRDARKEHQLNTAFLITEIKTTLATLRQLKIISRLDEAFLNEFYIG